MWHFPRAGTSGSLLMAAMLSTVGFVQDSESEEFGVETDATRPEKARDKSRSLPLRHRSDTWLRCRSDPRQCQQRDRHGRSPLLSRPAWPTEADGGGRTEVPGSGECSFPCPSQPSFHPNPKALVRGACSHLAAQSLASRTERRWWVTSTVMGCGRAL